MRDGPMERRRSRELMVQVNRIEVAAQAGEVDDVRFGDGAAQRFPFLPDLHIVGIEMLRGERHDGTPTPACGLSLMGESSEGRGEFARDAVLRFLAGRLCPARPIGRTLMRSSA